MVEDDDGLCTSVCINARTSAVGVRVQVRVRVCVYTCVQHRTGKGGERDFPLEFCVRWQFVSDGKLGTTATTTTTITTTTT